LRVCLFDRAGVDLRRALREDRAGPAELEALVRSAFAAKATWERGALETLSSDMSRIGG
jgi:predicted RNA polymerase sigma factor